MTVLPRTQLYIDGEWTNGTGSETITVVNPATEEPIAAVPQATTADVLRAVSAARTAFDEGPWPRMSPGERAAILVRMADILESRRSELVELNMIEAGSTRALAESLQVGITLEHFRDMGERVLPTTSFERPMAPYVKDGVGLGAGVVLSEPAGVAALITAFNFPLFLNLFKAGPALAAGCTTVLRPSPYTPLEALLIGEIAEEAGLPKGVLNIVTGDVASAEALTRSPLVDVVSFTGSDAVGRKVYTQAADGLKRVVLELGGKSANLILDDADIDKALRFVIAGFTTHCGQACSLLTRTLVHESLHDELVGRLKAALDSVVVGDPADPATVMGPLIREAQRERVEELISAGQSEGAQIAFGGGRPANLNRGYFVEPTLFVNVDNSMRIARQEVFGPVGVVIPFRDESEAVKIANDSEYGLAGGVWSSDPARAYRVARQLRTGYIDINGGGPMLSPHGPFGGYKQSGIGREWGSDGLAEFLVQKTVTWSAAAG